MSFMQLEGHIFVLETTAVILFLVENNQLESLAKKLRLYHH